MSENILIEVGLNFANEVCEIISPENRKILSQTFEKFIDNEISYEKARDVSMSILNNSGPIDKLKEIISVPETPLANVDVEDPDGESTKRKKTRTWSAEEDNRLIMGVYKFGVDNWNSIALFVGHSRNRSQCSQRWIRVLDPRISKAPWSEEENNQLMALVKKYGTKMWVKVASEMERRSDVQCRYRFKQLTNSRDDDSPIQTPQIPVNPPKQVKKGTTPYTELSFQKPPLMGYGALNNNQMIPIQNPIPLYNTTSPSVANTLPQGMTFPLPPKLQSTHMQQMAQQSRQISSIQTQQISPIPMQQISPLPAQPSPQQQIPNFPAKPHLPTIQALQLSSRFDQIPLARPQPNDGKGAPEQPLLLKSSGDFFKSDQLFDSAFWN